MKDSRIWSPRLIGNLVAAFALSGCLGDATRSASFEVTDSAGVRIASSDRPAWDSTTSWRLRDDDVLQFGEAESLYRVATVLRLSDGRFAVAERSRLSVLIYSPAGSMLRRFGGSGSGPGEFQDIAAVFLLEPSDSLLIFDSELRRASVFDSQGTFGRVFSTASSSSGMFSLISGVFADGSLLVADVPGGLPENRGSFRPVVSLRRYDPATEASNAITEFPGREVYFQDTPWGQIDMRRPYFGHSSAYAAYGNHVYWGITDAYVIYVMSLDGHLESIVRKRHNAEPASREAAGRLITKQLASVADEETRRQARRLLESMPVEGSVPAFGWPAWASESGSAFLLDQVGNMWVVAYFMPESDRNSRTVFDRDGRWLGTVDLPMGYSPKQIGSDFVAGVWTDSLGVEHIRVYGLIKP